MLSREIFKTIVKHTPLVAIDLVITNSQSQVLLGLRNNQPAQGFWFVPGGRIFKDESIENAFTRICRTELGKKIQFSDAKFKGVYEHLYNHGVAGKDVSTHYIMLVYELILDSIALDKLPDKQHQSYKWFARDELIENRLVHNNCKLYFNG